MMKKDKLYTVNKWNKDRFVPKANVFDWGGLAKADYNNQLLNNTIGSSIYANAKTAEDVTKAYMNSKNAFGISKADNPFSKGNLQGMFSKEGLGSLAKGVGSSLISTGAGVLGDAISGGLKSGAGSFVSGLGDMAAGIPGVGKFAAPALKIVGGGINALIGEKVDEAKLNEVNQNVNTLNSFTSNANSFDAIQGPAAVSMDTDVYKGGLLSGSEAKRKNRELQEKLMAARDWASRSVDNNIGNLVDDQLNDALANYSAEGGWIETMPFNDDNMGAIGYGFTSDYLNNRRRQIEQKDKIGNVFMGTPQGTLLAIGGDLQTHGGDWSDGLIHIDAGQSHELNPNDGVQMGTDSEGVPNLVEEGEVIWNDYVFSNRILCDETTKKMFHFPKKKDITYAEAAKKLEKEISERPNDPISRAGFKAQMETLEEQQERQKQEMEAERAKEAFEALSPEEQVAALNLLEQQETQQAMAQQQVMQQQMADGAQNGAQLSPEEVAIMEQQQVPTADAMGVGNEAVMAGQAPVMAKGGRLYNGGGSIVYKKSDNPKYDAEGELSELIVLPNNTPVPVTVENKVTALDVLNMAEEDRKNRLMEEYLEEVKKNAKNKNGRTEIHYYNDGGPMSDEEYKKWYESKNPYNKWFINTFGVKGDEELDSYNQYFRNAIEDLWSNSDKDELFQNVFDKGYVDSDLFNSIKLRGYMGSEISSLTPEQWKEIYNDYLTGYNNFVKEHPYIPYRNRMEPNYRKRWDKNYEGYEGMNSTSNENSFEPSQKVVRDEEGLIDFDNSVFNAPEVTVVGSRRIDTLPRAHSAASRGVSHNPDSISTPVNSDVNSTNEEVLMPAEVAQRVNKRKSMSPDTMPTSILPQSKSSVVEPITLSRNPNYKVKKLVPRHMAEWPRYAGLFGPVAGLGMMAAGIGKPDYSGLDAAVSSAGNVTLADYKPIGNYLTYRPMDIWYEQNALNAQARATDRAIMNNASSIGTKMAGLLASGYNSQIASGDLYRKALEYNDAKRKNVAEFNRGTDMFNAQAYNQNQQFNASAMNQGRAARASLAMQAAQERLNRDAGWYNSLYGNVAGLFKGIGDLGRENYQYNQMVDLLTSGAMPGVTEKKLVDAGYAKYVSEGGKIKRKKGKKGLTY